MNALADKVHKQELPHTQWYALHIMATLFNNHPYIAVNLVPTGVPLLEMVVEFTFTWHNN